MVLEAGFIKPQNNLISNLYNMLLETEKIKKGSLGHCGYLALMLNPDPLGFPIPN